jgi:SAM-dependent methyltransferase
MQELFQEIYDRKEWGSGSGPGSHPQGLGPYYDFLEHVLQTRRPARVLDLGCGYFAPYAHLDWGNVHYTGIDVVANCVRNNAAYATSGRMFLRDDWSAIRSLPDADLAVCKDVLQHWSHNDVCKGLLRLSKYPIVLITNSIAYKDDSVNQDIKTGGFRPLNLLLPPYSIRASESKQYRLVTNRGDQKLMLLWQPRRNPLPAAIGMVSTTINAPEKL